MYKSRFRRWGLWKHNQADKVVEIVRLKKERDAAHKPSEFLINGRRVDLERIESYLRRNDKMRRYLASAAANANPPPTPAEASAIALICRTPSPDPGRVCLAAPDELQSEEIMYRAIRDYYDGAFSSRRWIFDDDADPSSPALTMALQKTSEGIKHGLEIWLRFRAALILLEQPLAKDGSNHAEGIKLMRVSFAQLSQNILSGHEAPMLLFWIMHVMTLFRESHARDFHRIEMQLLKHLYELTTTTPSGSRHATSFLWRTLWGGGKGIARDRHHLRMCTAAAVEQFARHIGHLHPRTVELLNFSIFSSTPAGGADAADKEARFRDLYRRLETLNVFDGRHLEVVCCLASHLRRHGKLAESAALLEEILHTPKKANALSEFPAVSFNVHSLLGFIKVKMEQPVEAESYYRTAVNIAKVARQTSDEDGDLFEGLMGLEMSLRAQGKQSDADAVLAEHRALVKESLEKMGEREDSV
ncbi:hypothetical protein B0H67DRAFT_489165 [Lasiosphaeris hirsuta]|uniref:Clr5 domain-containing protein n=1 Tax=Lasiosphaeris hirsuta TaxID=260670 RepID=A0AA40AG32_9PEZI|nr:hypothetical protein B0H67DRAFT_489165 [Lasiosphaeris hirsuta]